jgi:hypothetical protein
MRDLVKLIFGGLLLFQFSCSKSDSTNPSGPTINSPSPIPDGLSFPVTQGSYWEYQRIDSFTTNYVYNVTMNLYTKADTSRELITLVGDDLVSSIDPTKRVLFLEVKNLTNGSIDTNYVLYTVDRLAFFKHDISERDNSYYSPVPPFSPNLTIYYNSWAKQQTIPLPVRDFYVAPANQPISVDTTYTLKDTSIVVAGTTYNSCVFADYYNRYASFAASGVGGHSQRDYSFYKPGIGIVFEYFTPTYSQGTAFDKFHGSKWTVRRLVSYKIK